MRNVGFLLLILLAAVAAWYLIPNSEESKTPKVAKPQVTKSEPVEVSRTVKSIVSSEELILSLTSELRRLNRSLANLQLPDSASRSLFSRTVNVGGKIVDPGTSKEWSQGVSRTIWALDETAAGSVSNDDLKLWDGLLGIFKYLNHGKFDVVSGGFTDTTRNVYQSQLDSSGSALLVDGTTLGWTAEIEATWSRGSDDKPWTISSWKTKSLETTIADRPIFVDVLAEAIEDGDIYSLATTSLHQQKTSDLFAGLQPERSESDLYPFFFSEVTLEHPAVAVVDIDADGWDDVFVSMQHSRNLLLRNRGDGSFEECASRFGLEQTAHCSAAIFADFDNDGDPDLFLGRPRHRGQYLVNNSGTFVDRTEDLIGTEMPYMIASISAADYNGDGLLDVHLTTYGPLEIFLRFSDGQTPVWSQRYLNEEETSAFKSELDETHVYLDRPGPPNMLLVNTGGGAFDVAQENEQIRLWSQSFQATWNDFDSDGDPDLYVSNDYGSDNFLRNDFPDGFTDITQEAGIAIGWGMGVSFNDYNNDGVTDLYVTNMYSKAGRRITEEVEGIDPRFKKLATGNYLYRGNGEKFELVSGIEQSDMPVAKAGWAWGSQFLDFNNDGFVDIFSPNGYYTAPADVAVDVDL